MPCLFHRRITKISEVQVTLSETLPRFFGQPVQGVAISVRRTWPLRRPRRMVCEFTPQKSGATICEAVASIKDKDGEADRNDLVPLIDLIQESDAWQKQDKDLLWFLDQLRLVAGVTPVKV